MRSRATTAIASRRRWRTFSRPRHKLAEEMYKSAGAAARRGTGSVRLQKLSPIAARPMAARKKKDEDVIDAEYEVKE